MRKDEQGKLNPAQIMNHFTDEEEHREVAALLIQESGKLKQHMNRKRH